MARKPRAKTTKKKAPRRGNTTVVVAKTRHHTKRRAVRGTAVGSTAAVGKTKKRKKRSAVGFTTGNLRVKDGVYMILGAGAGIVVNRKVMKPLAARLSQAAPMVAPAMGLAQAVIGFAIAMKSKHIGAKAFGVTIMGGGVDTMMQQAKLDRFIPGISGPGDDYTTVAIPISGPMELRSMVAGLLTDSTTPHMNMTGDNATQSRRRGPNMHNTNSNADNQGITDYRLRSFVGESEFDVLLPAKGANF